MAALGRLSLLCSSGFAPTGVDGGFEPTVFSLQRWLRADCCCRASSRLSLLCNGGFAPTVVDGGFEPTVFNGGVAPTVADGGLEPTVFSFATAASCRLLLPAAWITNFGMATSLWGD